MEPNAVSWVLTTEEPSIHDKAFPRCSRVMKSMKHEARGRVSDLWSS